MEIIIIIIYCLIILVAPRQCSKSDEENCNNNLLSKWKFFKAKYGTFYSSKGEDLRRRKNWGNALKCIEQHNLLFEKGAVSYAVGENKFSDMDEIELSNNLLMKPLMKTNMSEINGISYQQNNGTRSALPEFLDWRHKRVVATVKDQGYSCGSCWAFATAATIESHWAIAQGANHLAVPVSEQELIDCSRHLGNFGCTGGQISTAYQYVINNERISKAASYPYEERDSTCRAQTSMETFGASLSSFVVINTENEETFKEAVATKGPLAIYFDVHRSFYAYNGTGVYYSTACRTNQINHAMAIVGYGNHSVHGPYWLVRNSWGSHWGDKGYVKIARGKCTCGLCSFGAHYPVAGGSSATVMTPNAPNVPSSTPSVASIIYLATNINVLLAGAFLALMIGC